MTEVVTEVKTLGIISLQWALPEVAQFCVGKYLFGPKGKREHNILYLCMYGFPRLCHHVTQFAACSLANNLGH